VNTTIEYSTGLIGLITDLYRSTHQGSATKTPYGAFHGFGIEHCLHQSINNIDPQIFRFQFAPLQLALKMIEGDLSDKVFDNAVVAPRPPPFGGVRDPNG